tara:strand:- start:1000 stop:1773 length:774 start_codon:yes stop_codon:yes gene_type:complete
MVMKSQNPNEMMSPGLTTSAVPDSVSLDLPPSIQSLLTMPSVPITQPASPGMMPMQQPMQQPMSYQEGGMVQPGMQPQAAQQRNPAMVEAEINQTLANNPEVVARIRAAIEAGIQSGELDINELNTLIQLAKTVQQNPAMYPQIRQMAIQRGILPAEEIPEQYDEGLIIALIMASKAMEADVQIQSAEGMQPQPTQMMNDGGVLKGPSHEQGGMPMKVAGINNAEVEGGEYIIPKNVVAAKGTEFFDRMLAQYEDNT